MLTPSVGPITMRVDPSGGSRQQFRLQCAAGRTILRPSRHEVLFPRSQGGEAVPVETLHAMSGEVKRSQT